MTRIGIIIGSTRPGRVGEQVARWVLDHASERTDASYELIDLVDAALPLLDEPVPPAAGRYEHAHTRAWAAQIAPLDGFVMVTPEYNRAAPAALTNAISYLYAEWNNKAVGFVSYGSTGGVRAVENLRLIAGELQLADVRQSVALSLRADFRNYSEFAPDDHHIGALSGTLDQVVAWSNALAPLRTTAAA